MLVFERNFINISNFQPFEVVSRGSETYHLSGIEMPFKSSYTAVELQGMKAEKCLYVVFKNITQLLVCLLAATAEHLC